MESASFSPGTFRSAEITGQNPAVQNATQETQQFVEDKVYTKISGEVLVLKTDESTYSLGEPVITEFESGESKTITWDQQDENAPTGKLEFNISQQARMER